MMDSHCHVYAEDLKIDLPAVIQRAELAGVTNIFLPAIDSSTHEAMLDVAKKYPQCKAMMGLHPCSVKDNYLQELETIYNYLQKQSFVAIGETGLDFYWDKTFIKQQYAALEQQMKYCLEFNLPIVLHTRSAIDETIAAVKPYAAKGMSGIFHCFSGTKLQADQIIEMGFYLGIGGVVTFKNSGMEQLIKSIDLKQLLLETDAPYLAPVPYRGKRNEPSYLNLIAQKIAAIKEIDLEEVIAVTRNNTKAIFKI